MKVDARDHRGETVLTLHGSFAPCDADELRDLLRDLDRDAHVTIDFHEVRSCHDAAVAKFARELDGARVTVRGLSEHHLRLLRYLGFARQRA